MTTNNMTESNKRLANIIKINLELNNVYVVDYDVKYKRFMCKYGSLEVLNERLDFSVFDAIKIDDIHRVDHMYITCFHQEVERKQLLILENQDGQPLKKEKLFWLELMILCVRHFKEQSTLMECFLNEIQSSKQNNDPILHLKKQLWMKIEDDKQQLARELHDTILQEQIFLIREMDTILYESEPTQLKEKIATIHQQFIALNRQLREYCEVLKPSLLDTLGLQASLNKLFSQTKKNSNFTLIHSIDSIDTNNVDAPLLIYRIIQEMLKNAVKHSKATYVKIQLNKLENGFEIFYMDNGVGCNLKTINQFESKGLTGMKEKVQAFNGIIEIDSYPEEGMQIRIRFEDGL